MRVIPEAVLRAASTNRDHRATASSRDLSWRLNTISTKTPEALSSLGPGFNFIEYETLLFEESLLFTLTGEERLLAHLSLVLRSLSDDRWRSGRFFDDHIQVPFVLGALALTDDLMETSLDQETEAQLRSTIRSMARHLHDELRTKSWGSVERARWNHGIIGYAALGLAAVVLQDREAEVWLELATERARLFLEVGVTPAGMTWEGIGYCRVRLQAPGSLPQRPRPAGSAGRRLLAVDRGTPRTHREVVRPFDVSARLARAELQRLPLEPKRGATGISGYVRPRRAGPLRNHLGAARRTAWSGELHGANGRWSSLAEAMLFHPVRPYDESHLDGIGDVFLCADVGFVSARDSWSEDGTAFAFNCGPFVGKIHDQSDNNSFTFNRAWRAVGARRRCR